MRGWNEVFDQKIIQNVIFYWIGAQQELTLKMEEFENYQKIDCVSKKSLKWSLINN